MTVRKKIEKWVEENPDGYLKHGFNAIAEQCGCSAGSVGLHLPNIIADRDGILPSDVMKQREAKGFKKFVDSDSDTIDKIIEYHKAGHDPRDISFILSIGLATVKKHIANALEDEKGQ